MEMTEQIREIVARAQATGTIHAAGKILDAELYEAGWQGAYSLTGSPVRVTLLEDDPVLHQPSWRQDLANMKPPPTQTKKAAKLQAERPTFSTEDLRKARLARERQAAAATPPEPPEPPAPTLAEIRANQAFKA